MKLTEVKLWVVGKFKGEPKITSVFWRLCFLNSEAVLKQKLCKSLILSQGSYFSFAPKAYRETTIFFQMTRAEESTANACSKSVFTAAPCSDCAQSGRLFLPIQLERMCGNLSGARDNEAPCRVHSVDVGCYKRQRLL
jgi:hypothetical protein